jgi:hypothetical protein
MPELTPEPQSTGGKNKKNKLKGTHQNTSYQETSAANTRN